MTGPSLQTIKKRGNFSVQTKVDKQVFNEGNEISTLLSLLSFVITELS